MTDEIQRNSLLICVIMHADSDIVLDPDKLMKLLEEDIASTNGTPMTDDEVERLCLGDSGDDTIDGVVPTELIQRFPKTDAYISSFF